MRKHRTSKAARGRPNKCVVIVVNGVSRQVCFDRKGRVRKNRKLDARKRKD